jgi:pimeloyl-ACP methyl ester carboxylesterase
MQARPLAVYSLPKALELGVRSLAWLVLCGACARHPPIPSPPAAPADAALAPPEVVHLSDESILAIAGTRLLVARGELHDPEATKLEAAMHEAYARMRADEDAGGVTLVGGASERERMWLAPTTRSAIGIVFLHGYGGRFALPCWQVAHAVASLGAIVACPSIGTEGDWWSADGEKAIRSTLDALDAFGTKKIVLAGLSNGAIGVARVAARLGGRIHAVVLISGADPAAPKAGVPALVIQGKTDAMSSAAAARAYAGANRARYVDFDSGHFVMLTRSDEVERTIHDWIADLP